MENEEKNPETQQETTNEEVVVEEQPEEAEPEVEEGEKVFNERLQAEIEARTKAENEANKLRRLLQKKSKLTTPKDSPDEEIDVRQTIKELALAEKKRQYGYDYGLSPKEVDMVFKISNNNPTADVLNDDFVKGGLEKLRAKARVANNVPSSSAQKSAPFQSKDWSKLSDTERNAAYQKYVASKVKR